VSEDVAVTALTFDWKRVEDVWFQFLIQSDELGHGEASHVFETTGRLDEAEEDGRRRLV